MGYIEVNKVDSDYSNIKLEGVKFEIRDNNNTLIETLIGIINGNKDTRKEFENFIKNI